MRMLDRWASVCFPQVPCRVAADWGNLNDAERVLVLAALRDPRNQRFVLMSDSDIPLYPAPMVWAQLMAEDGSRVGACTQRMVCPRPDCSSRAALRHADSGLRGAVLLLTLMAGWLPPSSGQPRLSSPSCRTTCSPTSPEK